LKNLAPPSYQHIQPQPHPPYTANSKNTITTKHIPANSSTLYVLQIIRLYLKENQANSIMNLRSKHYLKFLMLTLALSSCGTTGLNPYGKVWISTADTPPGMWFNLGVLDLKSSPYSSYIVSHQEEKRRVYFHEDSVFIDTSLLGKIVYEQASFMALKDEFNNSIHYHAVPDLGNADSIDFVYNLLISSPILYQDKNLVLKMQFEPIVNSWGWNKSLSIDSLRQIDMSNFNHWTSSFDYNFFRRWHLTTLNNSIILLNSPEILIEGFALDILLVEDIQDTQLIAKKIEIPIWERNSILDSIDNGVDIEFQYEECVLKKYKVVDSEMLNQMYYRLCHRTWTKSKADSITYFGEGFIPKKDTLTKYPKSLTEFTYKFFPDSTYEISIGGIASSGAYEFSRDGDYLLLDKANENASCMKIILLSPDNLKLQQLINVSIEGRAYNRYTCYLSLE